MTEHSKYFSPSSIERRIICLGSAVLEDQITEEGPKPAADWGSFGHHIVDDCLKNNIEPESYLGKEMFGQVCDQEMLESVKQVLDDVAELLETYPGGVVSTERKVDMGWLGYLEMFGTNDLSSDELFGTLVIEDHKFGAGVNVEPENNGQLMSYALMTAGNALMSYKKIVIAISQPRSKSNGKSLKIWETTPEYLVTWWKDVLEPTIIAIKDGYNKRVVTEDGCRFCKAKDICPEFSAHALELARIDFADHTPTPPLVDDELVTRVYPHLPLLKDWIKRVEGHAYSMVCNGELPGFKLVNGRRSRDWKDVKQAEKALLELGIDAYEQKLLSPAKAEKQGGKEAKTKLKALIKVNDGKPVITHENDKRKAISLAAEDFKNMKN